MATKTQAANMVAVKIEVLKVLTSIDRYIDTFDTGLLEELSKLMRQTHDQWNKRRSTFDAKLKTAVDAGTVSLGDESKGTGILPVRAWRSDDAKKPGRKVTVKSAAERAAEAMGIDVSELPEDLINSLNGV